MTEKTPSKWTDARVIKMLSSLQSGTEDVVPADFARRLEALVRIQRDALIEARGKVSEYGFRLLLRGELPKQIEADEAYASLAREMEKGE